MAKLSASEWRDLILSVGTHKSTRRLSPIEVAEYFKRELDSGTDINDIAQKVLLNGPTMVSKFLKLLQLNENIKHLIDWGQSEIKIPPSVAFELVKLNIKDQEILVTNLLENLLSKEEVIQIVQIKKRSKRPITDCIEEVLKMRPTIEKKYLLIGLITNIELVSILKSMKQNERDRLMDKFIFECEITAKGRLGENRFSISGDESLYNRFKESNPDFETLFNNWLTVQLTAQI